MLALMEPKGLPRLLGPSDSDWDMLNGSEGQC